MDVTPLVAEGRQVIHAYREGGFSIAGTLWHGPVIVLPDRTVAWQQRSAATLSIESLQVVLDATPRVETLIVGTGSRFTLVAPALRAALRDHGIIIEAMATPPACRTFNVLLVEDRRVAAALLPVG
jgi:uncharacterized protein